MKARHILGLAVLMAVAGSCKKNQNQDTSSFSASIEVDESRTYLDGMTVKWSEGDQIIVYGGGAPKTYTLSTGDGTQTATFTTTGGVQPASTYHAFYPASSCTGVSGDVFTFTMPATQTYTSGGFMNNLNPMAAKNDGNGGTTLGFRNAFAILKVSATGNNCAITSIELTTTGNAYQLSGTFTFDYINKATSLSSGTGNTITLSGISTTLTSTPQPFYFVVPPQALANGFSVTFKNGNTTIGSDVIITADQVTSNYTLAPNKIFQLGTSSSPLYVEARGIKNLFPAVNSTNWNVSTSPSPTLTNGNHADGQNTSFYGIQFTAGSSGEINIAPTSNSFNLTNGHKYYVRFWTFTKNYSGTTFYNLYLPVNINPEGHRWIKAKYATDYENKWQRHAVIFTMDVTTTSGAARIDYKTGNNSAVRAFADAMFIDLTEAQALTGVNYTSMTINQLNSKSYFYGITPS